MAHEVNTVFIVEDDPSVRDALGLLLGLQGLTVALFADAESFLAARRPDWYGCLLIDIRMPGMDGLTCRSVFSIAAAGCR
jgi:FixJ family two-component response regulator